MTPVALAELLGVPGVRDVLGDRETLVTGVASDSRKVVQGELFAAISGGSADGASFAPQAIARGAAALLSDRALDGSVPVLLVDDVRKRLGPIAHRVFGEPTRKLQTVAVTGTNGKTTVTHLIESVLSFVGARPALLGTVAQRGPAYAREAELTTPEADVIARFASEQLQAGATHLLMEASSVAVDQNRLLGLDVEVAAFTNLTQDHLDYHGTMQRYGDAKQRLFTEYAPRNSVICVDHEFGQQLSRRASGKVLRVSVRADAEAELRVLHQTSTRAGIAARVETPHGELLLTSPLFGAHNLENLLVTVGVCLSLGIAPTDISRGLLGAVGAPGRMERVRSNVDLMVLVDYAHTPDAVERALSALRPLTDGRLFVVCGCGGDRDRAKRAPMAEAAVRGADVALLTSDNPRTEQPAAILEQMEIGARRAGVAIAASELPAATRGYTVIEDRAAAIRAAISAAKPGDSVLLVGKGHETYQIIGSEKRPFDDRVEAASALRARGDG